MQNQRGFVSAAVLIAIVLGLIVVGGGAYFVMQKQTPSQNTSENFDNVPTLPTTNTRPTPSATTPPKTTTTTPAPKPAVSDPSIAGWQTYQDKKYGYEFKYPDTLKLVQGTTNGPNGVTLNKSGAVEFGTLYPSFEVVIDPSTTFGGASNDVKIDGYLFTKTIVQRDAKDLPDYVTICNKSGYSGFTVERYLVLTKGFYNIAIRGIVCQDDKSLLPTFEKILSTFHYTANAETPNGKIYQNNTFEYTVEIPQPWFVDQSKADTVVISPDSSQSKYLGVISVIPNTTSETLDSLRKQAPSLNEDVLVGGQKAIRGILDFEGAGSYYVVKLIYQNKIYTLDRRIATPEIFSTFKFTR